MESRRFGRVIARLQIMAVGKVRFTRGLLMTLGAIMIPGLSMMLGSVLKMLARLSVMLNGFDRRVHYYSEIEWSLCPVSTRIQLIIPVVVKVAIKTGGAETKSKGMEGTVKLAVDAA